MGHRPRNHGVGTLYLCRWIRLYTKRILLRRHKDKRIFSRTVEEGEGKNEGEVEGDTPLRGLRRGLGLRSRCMSDVFVLGSFGEKKYVIGRNHKEISLCFI